MIFDFGFLSFLLPLISKISSLPLYSLGLEEVCVAS